MWHVPHVNESCCTHQGSTLITRMSHATHTNESLHESWHLNKWVWRVHKCAMSRIWMRYDECVMSLTGITRHGTHRNNASSVTWRDAFIMSASNVNAAWSCLMCDDALCHSQQSVNSSWVCQTSMMHHECVKHECVKMNSWVCQNEFMSVSK